MDAAALVVAMGIAGGATRGERRAHLEQLRDALRERHGIVACYCVERYLGLYTISRDRRHLFDHTVFFIETGRLVLHHVR